MVDWGIVAFFVVQLGITFAVYHALGGVKAEKSVLVSESERLRLAAAKFDVLAGRLDTIEKAPVERTTRMDRLTDDLTGQGREVEKLRKAIDAVDAKVMSLNGRIAANAKAAKRAALRTDVDGGQDPDPQGEEGEQAQAPYSPGSFPRNEQPQASAIPPGFGVVRRAV